MNLIDYFNSFQVESQIKNYSANARSLYFALLGEFNRCRFPSEMKLANYYLQQVSGITSSNSFDSARNALINGGLITYRKQTYKLLEKQPQNYGKTLESPIRSIRMSNPGVEKEKEKDSGYAREEDWEAYLNS